MLCRHFPDFLSLVTANQLTPAPALVFLGALSLVYLTTSDVYRCQLCLLFGKFCPTSTLQADRLCCLCGVDVHPGNIHAIVSDHQTLGPLVRLPFWVFSICATPDLTFRGQSGLVETGKAEKKFQRVFN